MSLYKIDVLEQEVFGHTYRCLAVFQLVEHRGRFRGKPTGLMMWRIIGEVKTVAEGQDFIQRRRRKEAEKRDLEAFEPIYEAAP